MAAFNWWWFETIMAGGAGANAAAQAAWNFSDKNLHKESWTEFGASVGNTTHILAKTGIMDRAFANVTVSRDFTELAQANLHLNALRAERFAQTTSNQVKEAVKEGLKDGVASVERLLPQAQEQMATATQAFQDLKSNIANSPFGGLVVAPDMPGGPIAPKAVQGLTQAEQHSLQRMNLERDHNWYPKYDKDVNNPIEKYLYPPHHGEIPISELDLPENLDKGFLYHGSTGDFSREGDDVIRAGTTYTDRIPLRVVEGDHDMEMVRTEKQAWGNYFKEKTGYGLPERLANNQAPSVYRITEKYEDGKCIERISSTANDRLEERIRYADDGTIQSTTRERTLFGNKYSSERTGTEVTSFRVNGAEQLKKPVLLVEPPDQADYLRREAAAAERARTEDEAARVAALAQKQDAARVAERTAEASRLLREQEAAAEAVRAGVVEDQIVRLQGIVDNPRGRLAEIRPENYKKGSDPSLWILNLLEQIILVLLLLCGIGEPDEGAQLKDSEESFNEAKEKLYEAKSDGVRWSGQAAESYNGAVDDFVKAVAAAGIDTGFGRSSLTTLKGIVSSQAGADAWSLLSGVSYTRWVLSILLMALMPLQGICLKLASWNPLWSYAFQISIFLSFAPTAANYYAQLARLSATKAAEINLVTGELRDLIRKVEDISR